MTEFDEPGVEEKKNPWGKHTENHFRAPHQFPMRCPACNDLAAEYIWTLEGACPTCNYKPRRKKTVRDMAIESWQVNAVLMNRDPDVRNGFPGPEGWTKKHLDIFEDTFGGVGPVPPSVLAPDLTPQPLEKSLSTGTVARNLQEWTTAAHRHKEQQQKLRLNRMLNQAQNTAAHRDIRAQARRIA